MGDSAAERRVWASLPEAAREALEAGLSPTDLQTLLIGIMRARAERTTPAQVLRRWREDRFARPSVFDPRRIARVEARLWEMLPEQFAGVELSPVAPLGTCAAVATVSQNKIVSTVRVGEVLSDPTNALAVEAAVRRNGQQRVDLAASHRALRAQAWEGPGLFAHFRLFSLVSSARDSGSGRTEARMLVDHLGYWARVLSELLPGRETRLTTTVFDAPVLAERLADTVLPAVPSAELDDGRTQGKGYYAGLALGIHALGDDGWMDIGDGGLTTWTSALRGDAKERCLVSCISTERLVALSR
jgi:hypothetical protein